MQLTDENKDRLSKLKEGSKQVSDASEGAERKPFRADGYVNLLNKYNTAQDNSTAYSYVPEGPVSDVIVTEQYVSNGLFAKIIDIPAQEAVKKGFTLNIEDKQIEDYIQKRIRLVGWNTNAEQSLKWSRLYGGALAVMILNDGCDDLAMPVNWKKVKGIEEIVVYDRSCVQPDYYSLYRGYGSVYDGSNNRSKFRKPEFYNVFSMYGNFRVHESRCLVFQNGVMPEKTGSAEYRYWGVPEYTRIKQALRETITAHGYSVRLLERCVQAVYKMKNLSQLLATDEGENQVLKRLQVIDMARNILNSISIDSEGEDYDFRSISLTGVKEVIETVCNMLSAITEIPQTKLFGRSPAGMNSTGESDLENFYSFVGKIQEMQLKNNLCTLIDVIIQIGINKGELSGKPEYELEFEPLWDESETEKASVEQTKAATEQTKATTAQIYVDLGVLDPSEVRKVLKEEGKYNIEDDALPTQNNPFSEIMANIPKQDNRMDGDVIPDSVGVIVIKDDFKILVGDRADNGLICGPGGHIENWEDAIDAAKRETEEEFGIIVNNLMPIGVLEGLPEEYGTPLIYASLGYSGAPKTDTTEMRNLRFMDVSDLTAQSDKLFVPFAKSIDLFLEYGQKNNGYQK